jgi:DNA-binding response OmpR family regulator
MPENPGSPISKRGSESGTPISGHVLHVSNDREVGGIWTYALRQMGLTVTEATSAADALARWEQEAFDLIVIDVCGADLDGIELARQLRAEAVNPILLFTSNRDEADTLHAYQVGVDDCVLKPVSPSLFLAKVRAWLRRTWTVPAEALLTLQAGRLSLDPTQRAVVLASGSTAKLTNLEFRLLYLLMSHPGQSLPADTIVDRVWGHGGGDSVLLKNLVYRLRRKIESDPRQPRYIQTGAGSGYVFSP